MAAPDFVDFVRALDRCWLERRFEDLTDFIATDVVFAAPGGTPRLEGFAAAVDSYRAFMSASAVERFDASNFRVTARGDTAIVEYDWDMAWTTAGTASAATGHDVLVIARRASQWRAVWRTQIAAGAQPSSAVT